MRLSIEQEINGRAADVAMWLENRFAQRPVWLEDELVLAARIAGIALDSWWLHPEVMKLGITGTFASTGNIYQARMLYRSNGPEEI